MTLVRMQYIISCTIGNVNAYNVLLSTSYNSQHHKTAYKLYDQLEMLCTRSLACSTLQLVHYNYLNPVCRGHGELFLADLGPAVAVGTAVAASLHVRRGGSGRHRVPIVEAVGGATAVSVRAPISTAVAAIAEASKG